MTVHCDQLVTYFLDYESGMLVADRKRRKYI